MKHIKYYNKNDVSFLYHFVNIESLQFIIENDFNLTTTHNDNYEDEEYDGALSFTSNYDFKWKAFRLKLSTAIHDAYVIKPFNYHKTRFKINSIDQNEYRLFTTEPYQPIDIKPYLVGIQIKYSESLTKEDFVAYVEKTIATDYPFEYVKQFTI